MNEYLRADAPNVPPLTVKEVDAAVARALRESPELEPADMEQLRALFDGGTWREGTRFAFVGGLRGTNYEITLIVEPASEVESRVVVRGDPVGPTLAEAVAAFNAPSRKPAGERPLTVEELRAAMERDVEAADVAGTDPSEHDAVSREAAEGFRKALATGRLEPGALIVALSEGGEDPQTERIELRQRIDGEMAFTGVRERNAPTLAEAVAAFNASFVTGGGNMFKRPLTEQELRAAMERSVRPRETDRADRVATVADYPELVDAVRTALATGRMPPNGRLIPYGREPDGGGEGYDIMLNLPLDGINLPLPVRVGGITWAVRERVAAALAAAAADDDLPVETRLKLLRETAAPGSLTAEQTAWLFAALAETTGTLAVAEAEAEATLGNDAGRQDLTRQFNDILGTMAKFEVAAPDAATARILAGHVFPSARRDSGDSPAAKVLQNTAGTAAGLRVLLEAAAVPGPADEPVADEGQRGLRRMGVGPPSPAERHRRATAALLNAVRAARPATDEAAQVLLEAAASEDAAVRAAAVEALAGAGG